MARRRYITSGISTDALLNAIARDLGEFAALLYTWMVPHAEDDGTLKGNAEEIRLQVVPGLLRTSDEVDAVLLRMHTDGLLVWDGTRVWFPPDAFYGIQSYIPEAKRRTDQPECRNRAKNAAKRRETPKNTASLRFSPSPSPLRGKNISAPDGFDEFWTAYPRKRERAAAARCYRRLLSEGVTAADLIAASRNYAAYVLKSGTDDQYVAYGSTFLGPKRKWEDFVAGVPEDQRRSNALSNGARNALELADEMRGGDADANGAQRGGADAGADRRLLPPG